MNGKEEKEKGRQVINQLINLLLRAGFPVVKKGENGLDIDLDALAGALSNCTIQRTGETNIVRDVGKDGETDFVMSGTRAWITVTNPANPTEIGYVLIKTTENGISTEIWPNNDEATGETAYCLAFWNDLKPEKEPA